MGKPRVTYDPKLLHDVRRWYGKLLSRKKVAHKLGLSEKVVSTAIQKAGGTLQLANRERKPQDTCAACHHLCIMHRNGTGECLHPECSCDAIAQAKAHVPAHPMSAGTARQDRPHGRA